MPLEDIFNDHDLDLCFTPMTHFLPPGVAYTTGLSHNPFTWLPL